MVLCNTSRLTIACVITHVGTAVFLLLGMLVPAWVVPNKDNDAGVVNLRLGIWRVCLEDECRSVYHDDSELVQTLGGWYPLCQTFSILQMVSLAISMCFALLWFRKRELEVCLWVGALNGVTLVYAFLVMTIFLSNGYKVHPGTDKDIGAFQMGIAACYHTTGVLMCIGAMLGYIGAHRYHENVVLWRGYTRI